jgi:hypothetical protein
MSLDVQGSKAAGSVCGCLENEKVREEGMGKIIQVLTHAGSDDIAFRLLSCFRVRDHHGRWASQGAGPKLSGRCRRESQGDPSNAQRFRHGSARGGKDARDLPVGGVRGSAGSGAALRIPAFCPITLVIGGAIQCPGEASLHTDSSQSARWCRSVRSSLYNASSRRTRLFWVGALYSGRNGRAALSRTVNSIPAPRCHYETP